MSFKSIKKNSEVRFKQQMFKKNENGLCFESLQIMNLFTCTKLEDLL